jgi:hypothetical protein
MLGLLYFPRQSVFTPAVAKEKDVHGLLTFACSVAATGYSRSNLESYRR